MAAIFADTSSLPGDDTASHDFQRRNGHFMDVKSPRFPGLVVTHPASPDSTVGCIPAYPTGIFLDGQDITQWVTDFRVGGATKGAIELHLTVLVSSVQWTQGKYPPPPA